MRGIFKELNRGFKRVLLWIKSFFIALLVIEADLIVTEKSSLPDWIGVIAILLFLYVYIRRSKAVATILNLLLFGMVYAVGAIRDNGLAGCQKILYDFYVNTGAKIIAYAIVIGIMYAIWKSRK